MTTRNAIAVVALIATTTAGAAACPIGARCVVSTDTLACPSHKVAIELVNKSRRVNKLLTGAARENMVDEIVEKASRSACSALKSSVAVRAAVIFARAFGLEADEIEPL